ncbi:MAG: hypothetical protein F6K39_08580 [Okeania sp. SIO3B3]|nr:hypothetical protein [Okeania sp. SIO3B3]
MPLTVLMLMGAVQDKNVKKIESKIERKQQSIENKEDEIRELRANYKRIRGQHLQRFHADGTINQGYVKNEENARKAVEKAVKEKAELQEEKKELKEEKKAYERGDLTKTSMKFPNQFNYVMEEARWSDNLLILLFFIPTALMSSGAVLIKNLVFTNDSYSEILQRLEKEAKDQEKLKYVTNTSANQIYSSIFNMDAIDHNIRIKIKGLQDEFESDVVGIYKSLQNQRLAKIREQAEKQALEENIALNFQTIPLNNGHKSGHQKYNQTNENFVSTASNTRQKDDAISGNKIYQNGNNNQSNGSDEYRLENQNFISQEELQQSNLDNPFEQQSDNYSHFVNEKPFSPNSQNYQVKNSQFPDPWVENNLISGNSLPQGNNQNPLTNSDDGETIKPIIDNGENSNQKNSTNELTSGDKNTSGSNQNPLTNSDDEETIKTIENGENINQTPSTQEEIVNFLRQQKRKN